MDRRLWRPAAVLLVLVIGVTGVYFYRHHRGAKVLARSAVLRLARRIPRAASQPTAGSPLYDELQPIRLSNCELERFGEPNDGGYLVCGNLLGAVEGAYSYGISGYDQWGCDISSRLHVTTHEYDCFDTHAPTCPSGALTFHGECVGGSSVEVDGRRFDTVERQIGKNGDGGKRLVVKMDVEGAEWESLRQTSDAVLDRIDQLIVEFHHPDDSRAIELTKKLTRLFYVAHLHFNNYSCGDDTRWRSFPAWAYGVLVTNRHPFPAWAYEVLLVNKRVGVPAPGAPVVRPDPKDAPNNPGAADCQY